ncbi:MAG: hypothetical protein M3480_03630 [Verrucomicrobiota bacterium]|nr:hypothetical protein [Chthoniobacterales bacterium]MDQ3414054.1 hypothetical protein [Verrucomicrobiota bacterium]
MKTKPTSVISARFIAFCGCSVLSITSALALGPQRVQFTPSYHNDVSPLMRDTPDWDYTVRQKREAAENPKIPNSHVDKPDPVIEKSGSALGFLAPSIPAPILNFDGIAFPGVGCNCAPPDTNGEVGATQYVQMVNEGYQVFDKATGSSILGPKSISSIWTGFGGVCETGGAGDPVVLYDQLAGRWVITQFAGGSTITDECIAVSTTSDATGSYYRYGFHLGSNFFDYPHLGVWPDAYYMSMNVFNSAGTAYLGPQAFAFDRSAMLTGAPSSFVSPGGALGSSVAPFLPADLDGSILPTAGAPNTFVGFPSGGQYTTYHFHADFATPSNSTFTTFATPSAAAFTSLCPSTRSCVPESGVTSNNRLDGIGDRLMFRLAYRKFSDGHESVVGNFSVSAGGVAGIRWFELRGVTAGPVTVFQESTYQPDTTWRWMGSAAMDGQGNLAIGYSASSGSIFPQLRYAGRLAGDPINTLAQGEAHLFDGTGSQTGTGNRWGDYSALTVDPVDDATFWYTNEYYSSTGTFNWRTRIGSFKLASGTPTPTPTPTATPTPTPTATPTPTPAADYSLSISPSKITIGKNGGTAVYTVTITPSGGFNSGVTLSVTGLPTGTTGSFNPNPATTSSALTLTVSSSTAKGTYVFTVTGVSSGLTRSATATLQKTAKP